ncbi:MAG: ribosome silencing factor [Candidatus Latescibacterota bacterium]|nr:MAG: ribosome silencing factor [Candidatus Latescibacterota bacterium]
MKGTPRSKKKTTAPTAHRLARLAAERAIERKAKDVVILDLRSLSPATDYFVIASGTTEVQVRAIADAVIDGCEGLDVRINHIEGYQARRWVLLDCIDVVVHVFLEEVRDFYSLERLWGDASLEKVEG